MYGYSNIFNNSLLKFTVKSYITLMQWIYAGCKLILVPIPWKSIYFSYIINTNLSQKLQIDRFKCHKQHQKFLKIMCFMRKCIKEGKLCIYIYYPLSDKHVYHTGRGNFFWFIMHKAENSIFFIGQCQSAIISMMQKCRWLVLVATPPLF